LTLWILEEIRKKGKINTPKPKEEMLK
jgi:hypothetical protein